LTADNAAAIAELCRRLDGIPLAIELAAARVASMSPAAILERVDERFRLLGQGRRTARRRHQTLRAAVDWSYGLLEGQEQVVFERLSVFAGDFTLEAAENVVADDEVDAFDVLDVVASLVAKSMVQLDERADRDRYRLLETMRDYGLERLAARGDRERFQQRHSAYWLDFVETAAPHFVGRDDTTWLRRIGEEYANIRAALLFTQEHATSDFVRMVFALAAFWGIAYHFREGLEWITAAHAAAPDVPGRTAAETLAIAAMMAVNLTLWDDSFDLAQQSLDRSAADGEPPCARTFSALALAALVQNRPEDSNRFGEESAALARARGDPFDLAESLSQTGLRISMTSDDPRGAALADESVEVARALGNDYALTVTLQAAGIARYRTDPARAIVLIEESFGLRSARGAAATATSRVIKAVAHLALRDDSSAADALLDALPVQQEVGEEYYLAMALSLAAVLLRRHGQATVAARILALNERLRDDGRIIGAPRDLESQEHLRDRLEREMEPDVFAALWAEGRAMTLDDAVTLALDALAPIADGG
jgi:hypothetical protein